jgi:hypothetical protein
VSKIIIFLLFHLFFLQFARRAFQLYGKAIEGCFTLHGKDVTLWSEATLIIDRCISASELIKKYSSNMSKSKSDGDKAGDDEGEEEEEVNVEIECLLLDGISIFKYAKPLSACFTLSDMSVPMSSEGLMVRQLQGSGGGGATEDSSDKEGGTYLVLGAMIPKQGDSLTPSTIGAGGGGVTKDCGYGLTELSRSVMRLRKTQPHRECSPKSLLYVEKTSNSITTTTSEQVLFFYAAPHGRFMPLADWLATKRPMEQVRTIFRQILQEFQV